MGFAVKPIKDLPAMLETRDPIPFADFIQRQSYNLPEKRMMRMILIDAIRILLKYKTGPLVRDVLNWMDPDFHGNSLIGFELCCEALGFDHTCVRKALLKKRRESILLTSTSGSIKKAS